MALIDPQEDFASYYRDGRDPDQVCERLYLWHKALWSRRVAGVAAFDLEVLYDRGYGMVLRTEDDQVLWLGSDAIVPTWSAPGWTRRFSSDLVSEVVGDVDDFFRVASTIGAYVLFPRNGSGRSGSTLNQLRGTTQAISDRFDLTLECIRRHYGKAQGANPLAERLAYDAGFFALFGDFDTYVRFFLLDDLLTDDRTAVRSLMTGEPIDGFTATALPTSVEEYAVYRRHSLDFVAARNARIVGLGL